VKEVEIIIENIQNKVEITDKVDEILKKCIELSFREEAFNIDSEIGFLLVDNDRIKEINSEYRKKDTPTDVLSFPMVEMERGKLKPDSGDFDMDENMLVLGDVVISMEMAKKQAEEYGHSFERELAFLATHGIFHLLGYDHGSEEEERLMLEKQEAVLQKMGLKR